MELSTPPGKTNVVMANSNHSQYQHLHLLLQARTERSAFALLLPSPSFLLQSLCLFFLSHSLIVSSFAFGENGVFTFRTRLKQRFIFKSKRRGSNKISMLQRFIICREESELFRPKRNLELINGGERGSG